MTWTPNRIAELYRLYIDVGLPFSECAIALGVTRNSCIGKFNREFPGVKAARKSDWTREELTQLRTLRGRERMSWAGCAKLVGRSVPACKDMYPQLAWRDPAIAKPVPEFKIKPTAFSKQCPVDGCRWTKQPGYKFCAEHLTQEYLARAG